MAGGDDKTVINENNNLWILERENGKIHCGGRELSNF